MRICFVVDYYLPRIGGGEIYVSGLAEQLVRDGHSCVLITSRFRKDLPARELINGVLVHRVNLPGPTRFWFTFCSLPFIVREARKSDIVQGASYGGAIPSFFGSLLAGKPCCLIVYEFMAGLWRNLEPNPIKAFFYQLVEKIIVRLPFACYFALSRYTRNCLRLLGVPDKKLEVAYGGMDSTLNRVLTGRKESSAERFGFPENSFIYLTYGRAGITKGIEIMAEATSLILKEVPQARFVFITTAENPYLWKKIVSFLHRLSSGTYRLFLSWPREKILQHIPVVDCVVIPSLSEGFGFAALEACLLGKSVVATDAGSLPEVISGKHLLVKPNSVCSLAAGCIRAAKGQLEVSPLKNFSWQDTARTIEKVYQKIMERRKQ